MLKTFHFKKLVLIAVFSAAVIFIAGAFFIYEKGWSSNEASKNYLPAAIGHLNSKIEAANKKAETSDQSAKLPSLPASKPDNNKSESVILSEEKVQQPQISATLFVEGKKYETSVPENSSVYDLMEKLQQETDFKFSGKNYPDLGFFVEEINGKRNDPKNSQYWMFYLNGKSANLGISGLKIKQNDVITWKYEKQNF